MITVSLILFDSLALTILSGNLLTIVAIGLVILLVWMPIVFYTSYTITPEKLKVRSGLMFSADIKIEDITQVRPTNTFLSSPALSIKDRIEIKYGKFDSIVISPKNRIAFCADLQAINPAIKLVF